MVCKIPHWPLTLGLETTPTQLFIQDEYDPMRPNDYEVVSKLREKRKQQAEVEAQKQAQMREMEAEFQRRQQVGDVTQSDMWNDCWNGCGRSLSPSRVL